MYTNGLSRLTVLKDTLDDPTAVRVRGEDVDRVLEGLNDELDEVRWDSLDALLDDVVAVLVLDAVHDMSLELLDELSLLVNVDELEGLLDDTAAIHLQREVEDIAQELGAENADLVRGSCCFFCLSLCQFVCVSQGAVKKEEGGKMAGG